MSATPTNKRRRRKREPKPEGRPTAYRSQYATMAFGFSVAGYTDKEMAGFFGVSESTFNLWKLKHPKFSESLKAGKAPANGEIAASMFKQAKGYTRIEERLVKSDEDTVIEKIEVYYPPSTTAGIFFLKNRMPTVWRDKHEQVLTDPNGGGAFDALAVEIARQIVKQTP